MQGVCDLKKWKEQQINAWQAFRLYRVTYAATGEAGVAILDAVMVVQPEPDEDGWYTAVDTDGKEVSMRIYYPVTVTEVWREAPDLYDRMPCTPIDYCTRNRDGVWMPPRGALMRFTSGQE